MVGWTTAVHRGSLTAQTGQICTSFKSFSHSTLCGVQTVLHFVYCALPVLSYCAKTHVCRPCRQYTTYPCELITSEEERCAVSAALFSLLRLQTSRIQIARKKEFDRINYSTRCRSMKYQRLSRYPLGTIRGLTHKNSQVEFSGRFMSSVWQVAAGTTTQHRSGLFTLNSIGIRLRFPTGR